MQFPFTDPSPPLGRALRFALRTFKTIIRLHRLRKQGVHRIPPNFLFFPHLIPPNATVIDVGCSHEAEFSVAMIERYGATAVAVDPTLKHRPALAKLVEKYPCRFQHVPFAISAHNTTMTFYESSTNESGSLLPDHVNAIRDQLTTYEVSALTPIALLRHLRLHAAEVLKLDIEGAEYELLHRIAARDIAPFRQIFVEFHHHAVERYSQSDTRTLVQKLCGFGYRSYSFDDHNYLFVRTSS